MQVTLVSYCFFPIAFAILFDFFDINLFEGSTVLHVFIGLGMEQLVTWAVAWIEVFRWSHQTPQGLEKHFYAVGAYVLVHDHVKHSSQCFCRVIQSPIAIAIAVAPSTNSISNKGLG